MILRFAALLAVCALLGAPARAAAQSAPGVDDASSSSAAASLPPGFEGPPPPVFPDTISRDGEGRVIVRAIRLTSPFRLDGRLDEAVYRETRPAFGFIQEEPNNGAPATEKTEIWILYDDENV